MHPRGWRSARPRLGLLLLALLTASPLYAQSLDVRASLTVTDGYARPGSYVPVTFKVTNRTGETVTELRLNSDSPVDVVVPWKLASGESGEKVVPTFYVGGELRLAQHSTLAWPVADSPADVFPGVCSDGGCHGRAGDH